MRRFATRFLFTVLCIAALFPVDGCGPTYPKEKLKESIIRICKKEYNIDVKVVTVGKTVAIYLPLEELMDFSFQITKQASEKINDVILSVSRVVLSTDAEFDFYIIIAHDTRLPEIQVVIIKSIDDVKRLLLNDISRGEYAKRILIDVRLSPQSQKEQSVKEVFQKMSLDSKWQEQVMNDFFRSEPAMLGDIGYWNGRFYVKDVTKPEFLAEQMASRMKIEFKEEKKIVDEYSLKSVKGAYVTKGAKSHFEIEVLAEPRWFKDMGSTDVSDIVFRSALKIAAQVMHIYRFTEFDRVDVVNQGDGRRVSVSKDDLEKFRMKKITYEELAK